MGNTNLGNLRVGFARVHYDGRKQGFWIGILSMTGYYMLSGVVGVWIALVPILLAAAVVHGRRPS